MIDNTRVCSNHRILWT